MVAVGTSDLPMKVRSLGAKTKQTMPGRMDIHVGFRHVIAAACLSINARGSVAPCCNPVLRRSPDSAKEVDNDNYCCATTRTRARTHTHTTTYGAERHRNACGFPMRLKAPKLERLIYQSAMSFYATRLNKSSEPGIRASCLVPTTCLEAVDSLRQMRRNGCASLGHQKFRRLVRSC